MRMNTYQNILTKDFFIEHHIQQNKNLYQISKEVGCDHNTVKFWLAYYGVKYIRGNNGVALKDHYKWKGVGDLSGTRFKNIKTNAVKRNIEFDLTIEQLWELYEKQNRKCALTGVKIGFVDTMKGNASLDRKNSDKGYTIDNVWWVHMDVNFCKQTADDISFIAICKAVAEHCANIETPKFEGVSRIIQSPQMRGDRSKNINEQKPSLYERNKKANEYALYINSHIGYLREQHASNLIIARKLEQLGIKPLCSKKWNSRNVCTIINRLEKLETNNDK